jgi:hypothetical protein
MPGLRRRSHLLCVKLALLLGRLVSVAFCVHERSHTCCCSMSGYEPNENCPVHGCGEWPPRCCKCGQFIKYRDLGTRAREWISKNLTVSSSEGVGGIEETGGKP